MNLKSLFIFREHAQIFAGNLLAYLLLLLRVNKGDTSSLETGTAETSAIYSITLTHDVVDRYEFLTSTLIVFDRALAALRRFGRRDPW